MLEESDLIVHQLRSHAVVGFDHIERHIACYVHGARIMLESCQIHGVSTDNVQLGFLSYGRRIERRLHVEVMTEADIILCFCSRNDKQKHYENHAETSKHDIITSVSVIYCVEKPSYFFCTIRVFLYFCKIINHWQSLE